MDARLSFARYSSRDLNRCEGSSCAFGIPLVTIKGRDNNGKLLVFFMGFIASGTTDNFMWFLQQFISHVKVPPKFVGVDQDFACINAIEIVIPEAFVILDEWHLNQNQIKNLKGLASQVSHSVSVQDMSNDLFRIRRSTTEEDFLSRRSHFEAQYLSSFTGRGVSVGGSVLPKWYYTLYHSHKELVSECFHKTTGGFRFLFQGTSITESANSLFHKHIVSTKTRFSLVPDAMLRDCIERTARNADSRKVLSSKHASLPRTVRIPGMKSFV